VFRRRRISPAGAGGAVTLMERETLLLDSFVGGVNKKLNIEYCIVSIPINLLITDSYLRFALCAMRFADCYYP